MISPIIINSRGKSSYSRWGNMSLKRALKILAEFAQTLDKQNV